MEGANVEVWRGENDAKDIEAGKEVHKDVQEGSRETSDNALNTHEITTLHSNLNFLETERSEVKISFYQISRRKKNALR